MFLSLYNHCYILITTRVGQKHVKILNILSFRNKFLRFKYLGDLGNYLLIHLTLHFPPQQSVLTNNNGSICLRRLHKRIPINTGWCLAQINHSSTIIVGICFTDEETVPTLSQDKTVVGCDTQGFEHSQSYSDILKSVLNFHRIIVKIRRRNVHSKCSLECTFITFLAGLKQIPPSKLKYFFTSKLCMSLYLPQLHQ